MHVVIVHCGLNRGGSGSRRIKGCFLVVDMMVGAQRDYFFTYLSIIVAIRLLSFLGWVFQEVF